MSSQDAIGEDWIKGRTLGSSDSIFKTQPDWTMNSCLNFSSDMTGTYTRGFKAMAQMGVEAIQSNRSNQDTLVYPIVFCFRHHIELQLKQAIAYGFEFLGRKQRTPNVHEVDKLWYELRSVLKDVKKVTGQYPDSHEIKNAERVILELAGLDPEGISFRYAKTREGVDPANVYKVTSFPTHLVGARNAEHLIGEEEFRVVHGLLKESNALAATFFETAYWTAMRFNEIYGLSLDDLFVGELDDQVLGPALDHHGIKYYGYIVLQSQPSNKIREREKDDSIKRKPLKGKPKIDSKYDRLVPIISKELFNNLVKFYKIQEEKFKRKVYGPNPKDYVLFEDLTHSETVVALREAYAKTKYTQKSYHCCRHTRCTELVGKTRDFVLARYWLGHARQETTLR